MNLLGDLIAKRYAGDIAWPLNAYGVERDGRHTIDLLAGLALGMRKLELDRLPRSALEGELQVQALGCGIPDVDCLGATNGETPELVGKRLI